MRIAVEGADCTGKSTLIKSIRGDKAVIHISGQPTPEYYREIRKLPDVVFDRFVLGDMVYNKPRMLTEEEIVSNLKSLDKLYLVHPKYSTHLNRCIERGEINDFKEFRQDHYRFDLVLNYLMSKYELELEIEYVRD